MRFEHYKYVMISFATILVAVSLGFAGGYYAGVKLERQSQTESDKIYEEDSKMFREDSETWRKQIDKFEKILDITERQQEKMDELLERMDSTIPKKVN